MTLRLLNDHDGVSRAVISSTMSIGMSTITGSYGGMLSESERNRVDFPAPLPLFGRHHEQTLLIDAYQRVVRNNTFELVVLHGESGTGKSALVDSLRESVCASQGYFCAGKYFQNTGVQEPYSAIMAAFSDLCDLISQSEDFNAARKEQIQTDLGSDGLLLARSISSLMPFLSKSHASNDLFSSKTDTDFRKFKGACRSFLHAMSAKDHPIVLFLDDIQWMDEGSRQLVTMFQQDDLENVMLVLTYRQEESATVTQWLLSQNQLANAKVQVTDISLKNLTVEAVNQLIADSLGRTTVEETLELSRLISSKTRGNAFHVIQFIEAIEREGLLSFNEDNSSWDYDVDTIQREMMIDDSVADLLTRKIQRLPLITLKTLQVASLLGYSFEHEILVEICLALDTKGSCKYVGDHHDHDHSTVVTVSLGEAFDMGFVEKTATGYQFVHDKLQAAFSSMFDHDDLMELHRNIGETYLAIGGVDSTYHAAVHLNQAFADVNDINLCLQLSEINRDASRYCYERSGFLDASVFLHRGLDLLDSDSKWTTNFDLSFEMTEMLAKAELACGNFTSCKKMVHEVVLHAPSVEKKIASLLVGVQCSLASNKVNEAADAGVTALRECGFRIPRRVAIQHVLLKRMRVKALFTRKGDRAILNLPHMQDPVITLAVELLFFVSSSCLLQERELLGVYAGLLATELTMKVGLAAHSPWAFTIFGLLEVSLGCIRQGYRLGKLALQLQDQLNCQEAECVAVAFSLLFLIHWKEPIREFQARMNHAVETGYACGDTTYAIFCASLCNGFHFVLGENLFRLEQYMRLNYTRFSSMDSDGFILMLQPAFQFVLNMQYTEGRDWVNLTHLTGEIMDEGEFVRKVMSEKNTTFYMIALVYKSILAYYFGFYSKADHIYRDMASIGHAYRNSQSGGPFFLFGALIYYEQYRSTKKRSFLRQARGHLNSLKRMNHKGANPNVLAFIALLLAVDASVHKSENATSLALAFDKAINQCASESLLHMEALANERAGFLFADLGLLPDAERYLARAEDLYLHGWGATSKYEWLVEKSGVALSPLRGFTTPAQLGDIIEMSHDDNSSLEH